ncbi:hypothetical protein ThidrDRAFT_4635 [Thiorhodococcus drewsii AZ1]|uniref:Uncharacterized protein n=2 Tax=Thiorhodococcus drewsii TaxID=210408 RepID=G2E8M1_9GAMM|nr:hypothetical protein ThidrDRAFT_4635 [Thiorhodococcus drewsii AZ1]
MRYMSYAMMIVLLNFLFPVYAEEIGGVEFPGGASSFADEVIEYSPTAGVAYPYNIPETALGPPDYTFGHEGDGTVSLGNAGVIILKFTDNSLTTSGDVSADLWIFEEGPAIEPTEVYIKTDLGNWISVGDTSGGTYGIDIDQFIGVGVVEGESYTYVKLVDLLPDQGGSPNYAGADIDAVGAISSIQSTNKPEIRVDSGYVNLSVTSGETPPEADCATSRDHGRMVFDEINQILHICSPAGWVDK